MPRKYQAGTYEGHPYYRWVKMYRGTRYRVSLQELKLDPSLWTKERSYQAANEWWRKKRLEIDLAAAPDPLDELIGMNVEEIRSTIQANMRQTFIEKARAKQTQEPRRTIGALRESFLAIIQGKKRLTFKAVAASLNALPLDLDADVSTLNADCVQRIYLHLQDADLAAGTKKNRWAAFKRLVNHAYETVDDFSLPKNLKSPNFEFTNTPSDIPRFTPQAVRTCLDSLPPRVRLFALLGLNCGAISSDIGTLTHNMIDWQKATITRKRAKTKDQPKVPLVSYKLWPETLQLLKEHQSSHPTLVLTSAAGTPLWEPEKDLIGEAFLRAKVKIGEEEITQKVFRKIGATWLEKHATYGRLVEVYLCHALHGIKDRHYAAYPQELFDEALEWLHEHLSS